MRSCYHVECAADATYMNDCYSEQWQDRRSGRTVAPSRLNNEDWTLEGENNSSLVRVMTRMAVAG